MGGKLSRTKGVEWERKVAQYIREHTGIEAKRTWQFRSGEECTDIGAGPFSIECKHTKRPNVLRALEQAEAGAAKGTYPVAVCRWHGTAKESAIVAMRLDEWAELVKEWHERGCDG